MRHTTLTRFTRFSAAGAVVLAIVATATGASAAGTAHARTRANAHSTMIRGTVVADNGARHTLVVALASGTLRTIRFSTPRRVSVGARITSRASLLGDGTYRGSTLNVNSRSRTARLHAVVVSDRAHRLELSGGGSVITVSSSGASAHSSSSQSPQPGDVVNVSIDVQAGALDETSIQQVGTSNLIGLQGVLASISATSLTLNVENGATTTVEIPASITLPSTIAAGDQVELLVAYQSQVFTLVTITDDSAAANNSSTGVTEGDQNQNTSVEIEGLVAAANATSITIQPGDNSAPVIVAIPSTLSVPAVTLGDRVHAVATMLSGVLTLVSLDVQAPEGDQGQSMNTQAEGQVVSVSATTLVIQPNDQATPVSFTVPSTVDVSSLVVGDQVDASGSLLSGSLTLTSFELQGDNNSQGDNSTEVDGTVTAISATSLSVTPQDQGAATTLSVPSTVNVSTLVTGVQINATATIVNGVLTLVSFEIQTPDQGSTTDTVDASGVVTAVSASNLSLQESDQGSLVSVTVPSTVDVSTITVGEHVKITAQLVAGVLTLVSVSISD